MLRIGIWKESSMTRMRTAVVSIIGCVAALGLVLLLISVASAQPGPATWFGAERSSSVLSEVGARDLARQWLNANGFTTLETEDIIFLDTHFYVAVLERESRTGAFELVMSRDGTMVHPAPGPTMMWNTAYDLMAVMHTSMMTHGAHEAQGSHGMHGNHGGDANHQHSAGSMSAMGGMMERDHVRMMAPACHDAMQAPSTGDVLSVPLTVDGAQAAAQQWLDERGSAQAATHPRLFSGYVTVQLVESGTTIGLLSVNTTTGDIWEHTAWGGLAHSHGSAR
jgi:hypothetical protein